MKMNDWMLVTGKKQEIPVVYNQWSNTVVADTQELSNIIHDLYWLAPESYLGDKVSSYGGFLTYQIKSFGLPSEGMTLLESRPDVQLRGEKMTIEYFNSQNPIPDRVYHERVQLVEVRVTSCTLQQQQQDCIYRAPFTSGGRPKALDSWVGTRAGGKWSGGGKGGSEEGVESREGS
uniref:Laminin IV type A domain-containing protein n=1 Tax=Callorhinchus milii TaxID=7868 RepID=A0A4W3GYA1_CALMI